MPEEAISESPTPTDAASPAASEFESVYRQAEQAHADNDLPRAYGLYVRATELEPNHAGAWAGRAATTSDLDEAIADWAYALALAPGDDGAREALNACIAGKIVQSNPSQVPSLIAVGRVLARAGQKAEAQRVFRGATELDPENVEAWIWRAGVTDEADQMISFLEQALAHDPNNAQAKAGLRWASSLSVPAEQPTPIRPEETAALMEEAKQSLASRDKARAHDLFKQVTERDPKNEEAWLWRGSTTPNVDEALASIEHALTINPNNPSAVEALKWLQSQSGHAVPPRETPRAPSPKTSSRPQSVFRLLIPVLILVVLMALIAIYAVARR